MKNKTSLILILGSVIMLGIIIYYMNFRTVTVEFAAKIGAGVAPITVKVGETVTEPTAPQSDEYKFLGWYLDDEKFDFSKPITKNIKLEAKWKKIEK